MPVHHSLACMSDCCLSLFIMRPHDPCNQIVHPCPCIAIVYCLLSKQPNIPGLQGWAAS